VICLNKRRFCLYNGFFRIKSFPNSLREEFVFRHEGGFHASLFCIRCSASIRNMQMSKGEKMHDCRKLLLDANGTGIAALGVKMDLRTAWQHSIPTLPIFSKLQEEGSSSSL
jgi:hypothetical protein